LCNFPEISTPGGSGARILWDRALGAGRERDYSHSSLL